MGLLLYSGFEAGHDPKINGFPLGYLWITIDISVY